MRRCFSRPLSLRTICSSTLAVVVTPMLSLVLLLTTFKTVTALGVGLRYDTDDPLLQTFRPPRQTPAQVKVMENITSWSKPRSEAAEAWVLDYMGNASMRARLHPSLANMSKEELLTRFTWEMNNMPIFHNAPTNQADFVNGIIFDDSPLNATLGSGFLQSTCLREALGGPEVTPFTSADSHHPLGYSYTLFFHIMGLPLAVIPNRTYAWPLSAADECFLFNANNLLKSGSGNPVYGGATYVLNRKKLGDRLLVEAWDAGNMASMTGDTHLPFPGFGTVDNWYHLVQMHEALFNLPYPPQWGIPESQCCNYSLADLFNRWW